MKVPVSIELRQPLAVLPSHLLSGVSFGTTYPVTGRHAGMLWIVDDSGERVLVSKAAQRRYFKKPRYVPEALP